MLAGQIFICIYILAIYFEVHRMRTLYIVSKTFTEHKLTDRRTTDSVGSDRSKLCPKCLSGLSVVGCR